MTTPSNEVAVQQPERKQVAVPLVGQLNDLDQAWRYAQALAQSNLLPKDLFGKTANVLAIMLYGQQLDLTPMQAIQNIYVVNGRPQMAGQLWLSKVREAGHRVKVSDHTDRSCTVTITRGDTGEEHSETFEWADAERAGLTRKDVWKSWPKRMLLWRAVSNCATIICPEVALGFGAEEPGEPVEASPTLAQVAAERVDAQPVEQPAAEPEQSEEDEQAAMLAEIAAIEREHQAAPVDAEVVEDEQTEDSLWSEVQQPGGGR